MMKKNNKGFSIIEAVLLLAIAAVIALAGWFVWKAKVSTSKTYNDVNKTSNSTASPLATYTNKNFGFKFVVPRSLGAVSDVSVGQDTLAQANTGKAYWIASRNSKLAAGFVTNDWQPIGQQGVVGFTAYDGCRPKNAKAVVTLYSDATTCVVVYGEVVENSGAASDKIAVLEVKKKFTRNKTTAGLHFVQQGVLVDDFSEATLTKAFGTLNGDMVTLAKSITEL